MPRLFRQGDHPRLRINETAEELRHATWLELFYDLVFVVAVAQLAHHLEEHLTVEGFLVFAALYVPVWWAWTGQTFYANRFDTDDTLHRLTSFLQVSAVAVLAASTSEATGERSTAFALAYAAVRFVLVIEYLRARKWVPEARPLIDHYLTGFGLAATLWALSPLLDEPDRYWVWGLAMLIDLGTPLLSRKQQSKLPPQSQHLPERFGLFVVIVLGEAFAGVIAGLTGGELSITTFSIAAAGIILAVGIWWIYFADVAESVALRTRVAGQVWVYGHLVLFICVTAVGVGIDHAILHPELERDVTWLVPLVAGGAFLAVGMLHAAAGQWDRTVPRVASAAACVVAALLGGAVPVLALVVPAVCAAIQVMLELTPKEQLEQRVERELASEIELIEDVEELERRGYVPPTPE